ncbi:unnamed protein product [Spirodela intermedia]|uniref:Uncharacterized protein n=2 Tax=Spirodela intermedia TaxID=51605 RepID=A0A7I8KK23_SPIIN|nr:unnamed protein product [Spirodela intermedia]CAA6661739.1 unnamed protein product [Spirodela intermedia]CAA7398110.1 unnamed protein product [Spirodela intermedia]
MEAMGDENWKLSKGSGSEYGNCSGGSRRSGGGGGFFGGGCGALRKGGSFSRRCASLVKEQRARFYIMRRCVIMLICWREYRDC